MDLKSLLSLGEKGTGARVRFGRGVIGKNATIIVAACVPLAVLAYAFRNSPGLALIFGGLICVTILTFAFASMHFAKNNPNLAMLEGADLLKWRQMDLAAKDVPQIPESPIVADPQNPTMVEGKQDG